MNTAGMNSGDEVDSYCGKCKIERVHNVVALVDGKVAMVICKMCGSRHRYRPVDPEPKESAPKATGRGGTTRKDKPSGSRRTASAKSLASRWEAAMAEKGRPRSRNYSMDGSFAEGEFLEHEKFGHGIVIQVEAGGKMQVLFKDGPKRLLCGAGPSIEESTLG